MFYFKLTLLTVFLYFLAGFIHKNTVIRNKIGKTTLKLIFMGLAVLIFIKFK